MKSSPTEAAAAAARPERTSPHRLVLGTTYAVVVSGALLLAVAEQAFLYALVALVFCAGHAVIVGPGGPVYLPKRTGKVLAFGALAFGLMQGHLGNLHLSYGLAHFLVLVQLITLYGPHGSRELRLIQVITIFEALVAGTWVLDLVYLPVFLLAAISLMANSAALAMTPEPAQEGRSALGGVEPASGWRSLAAGIWMPAVAVLALTALLFILLPRPRFGPRTTYLLPQQVTGFSENVSLHEVGVLRTSEGVALRVRFTQEDSPDHPTVRPPRMLLRSISLPVYRNGQWFGYGVAMRMAEPPARGEYGSEPAFRSLETYLLRNAPVARRLIRQRITIERHAVETPFALYRPVQIEGEPPYRSPVHPVSHHLKYPGRLFPGDTYEVVSLVPLFGARQLDEAGTPEPGGGYGVFWDLPSGIRNVLEQTAAEIERAYAPRTDYERVIAAQSYLLNPERFAYTYDLPDFGGEEPIAAFLTETRRGSCEQFSTALALLLRVWGIPTRLAIGYKGGQFDPDRQQYVVRDRNAHAWVEVYFNGLGWVEFDPTPGAEVMEAEPGGLLARLKRQIERGRGALSRAYRRAETHWGAKVVGYGRRQQQRLMSGLTQAGRDLASQATRILRAVWPGVPEFGPALVAMLVASITFVGMSVYLSAQWLQSRLRLRRRGWASGRTVPFYEEMLRILRRKGLRRPEHATPREFARAAGTRIAASGEEVAVVRGALELVTDLFCKVRFGGYELTDSQRRQVRQALRVLARADRARPAT
jgi:transglutaminase-like putative cysteine protease